MTAGAEVVGAEWQNRRHVDPNWYVGKGKAEELSQARSETGFDLLVTDDELSPGQQKALEGLLNTKVIDRSRLILDIFAQHARTHEGRLQVELAQLEYQKPRLKRMWTHLERMEGAIGSRGPGEKQIEEDKRIISKRISTLKRQLETVELQRANQSASRADYFKVSLVGYTNAGKSTLMNALTGADVLVEDKLFATLDTRTRRWQFRGGGHVLLSDTVGFIRNLPHELVASFKAAGTRIVPLR